MAAIRISTSVPEELKARMDAVSGVNWSAVAQAAFESKLAELANRKERIAMAEAIARFKALRAQEVGDAAKRGHDDGYEWASKYAYPSQLDSLRKALDREDVSSFLDLDEFGDEDFMRIIDPDREDYPNHAEFWWQAVGDNDFAQIIDQRGYVGGFADGALAFLRQAEAQ